MALICSDFAPAANEDIVKAGTETKAAPALSGVRPKRIPRIFPESDQIPDQIEQGLYLGSTMTAFNKKALKELNITHIITVRSSLPPPYPDDFEYMTIKVSDTVTTKIGYYFRRAFDFIEEAECMDGGVLVHCHSGVSRSATIVIGYLMKKYTMRFKDALKQVQAARSIVQPNEGFISQLLILEKTLQIGEEVIAGDGTENMKIEKTTTNNSIDVDMINAFERCKAPARIFPESDQIPDQIEQGLYLGSTMAALNKKALKELNITHIITVRASMPPPYPDDFEYKTIKVDDTVKTKIGHYFRGSFDFIEEAKLMGGGVLIHCHMGISRSATIVIAYLMKKYTMRFKDALNQVKAARSIIQPNKGFVSQLLHLEKILQSTY